jgi:hypothetical protein
MLLVFLITDQSQELCTGNGLRLTKQADAVPSIGMISAHVYEAAIYVIDIRIFAMRRREYEGRSQSTGQMQHASNHMIMHQAIAPHSDHSISIFESLTIPIKYTCISYKSPWVSSST